MQQEPCLLRGSFILFTKSLQRICDEYLVYFLFVGYNDFAKQRCSILVRSAVSEEGPKNPLKGITVKPLVPAAYAQFGVGAEWKA